MPETWSGFHDPFDQTAGNAYSLKLGVNRQTNYEKLDFVEVDLNRGDNLLFNHCDNSNSVHRAIRLTIHGFVAGLLDRSKKQKRGVSDRSYFVVIFGGCPSDRDTTRVSLHWKAFTS